MPVIIIMVVVGLYIVTEITKFVTWFDAKCKDDSSLIGRFFSFLEKLLHWFIFVMLILIITLFIIGSL